MPPTLTSKPTEAFLGGSKRFKCQVIGNPRPVIRWFKDGIDITNNPRFSFDFTMEGRISMVIPNVTYKDEGCYRCRAENSEGIASTASYLMVRGSVHEQRDEIPMADVAEMEIEEVYIKKKEERSSVDEITESSKRRSEKKDRWKDSELEITEEMSSSSSFQRSILEESSQSRSMTMESQQWQIQTESEDLGIRSDGESGFVFDGQSLVIESQVFGKTQEILAELDADPSAKVKPIFVDTRKRPSDELEAEDVIELVVQDDQKSKSHDLTDSTDSASTFEKDELLLITEESISNVKDVSEDSMDTNVKLITSDVTTDSLSKEKSREITVESDISQVATSDDQVQASGGGESLRSKTEITSVDISETRIETDEAGASRKVTKKEEKSSKEEKIVEDSLMAKMQKFKQQREEEVELFISEEKTEEIQVEERLTAEGKKLTEAEKKLTEAEKREQKRKEEAELKEKKLKKEQEEREKKLKEEQEAMAERIKNFKQTREEEAVSLFSSSMEVTEDSGQGESAITVVDESSKAESREEGRKVEFEEFYSKETSFEGDIELSREKRQVFSFESEISSQSFEEVTMEDSDGVSIQVDTSIEKSAKQKEKQEKGLNISADVAIEDVAFHDEEERLNAKNRKLSEKEASSDADKMSSKVQLSSDVTIEESSTEGSSAHVIESVVSEEVSSTAESRQCMQSKTVVEDSSEVDSTKLEVTSKGDKDDAGQTELVFDSSVGSDSREESLDQSGFTLKVDVTTEETEFEQKQTPKVTNQTEEIGVSMSSVVTESEEFPQISADVDTQEELYQQEPDVEKRLRVSEDSVQIDGVAYGLKEQVKITSEIFVEETKTHSAKEVKGLDQESAEDVLSLSAEKSKADLFQAKDGFLKAESTEEGQSKVEETSFQTHTEKVSEIEQTEAPESSSQKDVEGATKSARFRPKLTAEASVGEDETSLEAVVDVKETQTEKGEFNAVDVEKNSLAASGGKKSQVDVQVSVDAEEKAVKLEAPDEESADMFQQGDRDTATVEKSHPSELQSDVLTKQVKEFTVGEIALDQASEGDVAVKKDVPGVAEGVKANQQEYLAAEQEEKVSSETVSDRFEKDKLSANQTEETTETGKATKDMAEYRVGLQETDSEKVSNLVKEVEADSEVTTVADQGKLSLLSSEKAESKVASDDVEVELFITEDLETSTREKADVDGIAEGEKHKAERDLGAETRVQEAVVDTKEQETIETKVDSAEAIESDTSAKGRAQLKGVESKVDEISTTDEAGELKDVKSRDDGKALEITAETSVEAANKQQDESQVDVQSSVDSVQYSSSLEEKSSVAVSVSEETSTEKLAEVTITTEVSSSSQETLQFSTETGISENKAAEDERLEIEVDVSTDSSAFAAEEKVTEMEMKTEEEDKGLKMSSTVEVEEKSAQETVLKADVTVEETSEKPAANASVETDTTDTKEVVSISAEVEVSEKPADLLISADVDVSEVESVQKDSSGLEISAEVEVTEKTEEISAKIDSTAEEADVAKKEEEPYPSPPEITGPAEISVHVGETINIEVTITGFPKPEVTWKKDFRRVEEGEGVKVTAEADVYCLQILNAVTENIGKYRVTASNSEGRATHDVKVKVNPAKETPAKKAEEKTPQRPEKFPPQIEAPANFSVEVGQTLSVEVTVKGNPAPRVMWYKNNKPLYPNYRTKTNAEGDVYTIQILNTVEADAGCYRVTAVNQKGEESCDVMVTVTLPAPVEEPAPGKDTEASFTVEEKSEEGPLTVEADKAPEDQQEITSAAAVEPEPEPKPVDVSAEVKITEKVSAEVKITEKVSKDEQIRTEIKTEGPETPATSEAPESSEITSEQEAVVKLQSEGERTKEDVLAEVEIPTEEEKPSPSPPEIVNGPADISVEVGQTINIEVTISGFPSPQLGWTKDYRKVEEGGNVKMTAQADVYCLQILNAVEADAGKYRLTASNSEGRTTFDVKVKVTPVKKTEKKEEEKPKSKVAEKFRPQIDAPADVTVELGQTLSVEVTVKGNPAPRVMWYKNNKPVYPNYRTKTNAEGDVYTIQILNTVEADAGCYRVTAVNQKGEESCDVMATITLPAPSPDISTGEDTEASVSIKDMVPPEVTTKPESQSVREGEAVTLSATVTGRPPPSVTWFKNNTLLRTGYNCRVYKFQKTYVMEIAEADIFDAGRYAICAENPAGASFWTVKVDVEAASEPDSSTSTVGEEVTLKRSEETPDELFLKDYVMLGDFQDEATDFKLKRGETVQVLDTVNTSKWLVRKSDNKEKVCYVPVELLECKPDSEDSVPKAAVLGRKVSVDEGSSGEDDSGKRQDFFPLYVAVADYSPPEGDTFSLKLSEGQFVEVMDSENTDRWLVRTKPTKSTPSKQGWVPSSYLEEKDAKTSRSARESFREDIIKISNKNQEAQVKRRYVLTDFMEKEREYINQLKNITECFHDKMYEQRNVPALLEDKKDTIFGNLKDIHDFHAKVLLPALTNCTLSPAAVGKVFLNMKEQFEKYIPYGCGRNDAENVLSADDAKAFVQEYNRKSGGEQSLPECLRRPINRLHEYQAVLKDILKYTSRLGEDCLSLEGAIQMLSGILRRIEDIQLLATIEDYPGDINVLGPLIRHDDLQLWNAEPMDKGKERHVFLFPDKLLFAKRKKDGAGLAYKSTSELQDIQINEAVPSGDRRFELWYAEPTSEKLTLQAKNTIGRQAWAKDVRDALKALGVEETDIMPERRPTKPKVPTLVQRKSKDKTSPEKALPPGAESSEDYISFDSLDSDVSSYHTAPEYDDGSSRPFFKKRLRKTVVKEGDKVRLECAVGGIPLPSVAWQKGVYAIKSSDDLRIEVEGALNALVIPDSLPSDSGVYTAKATNAVGSAVCSAEVTVGEGANQSTDGEYQTAQSALSSDGEINLPTKMGQMDSCIVEEGKMARFDCNLVADPKPEIIWLKDGKILATSKKYEVLNPTEDLHSLIVHDVHKADSGRYVCWARNEFGEAFTEAYLNIIPSEEAEKDVERIAPKITKKFYALVAVNGHSAELQFRFIGSPKPHIQFYLKGKEILPPRDYEIKVDGDLCMFTLKDVSMEDAGKITAKLTNPLGEDSCSAQLSVIEDLSKPRSLPKVAPKFITRFTDVDVNEGFEARFKAKVVGEPIPTVTWLRNGVPLKDSPRYKYEEYGEIFILIIENAESGDAGEYTCEVRNKAGEASCKANLAVTRVKIPQVSETDSAYSSFDYGRRSQRNSYSPKSVKGANGEMGNQFGYAPVYTKMIQDCDTKEGRRAEFECRAYGMPEPSAAWTHNGYPLERGSRFIMSKDEDSNYHLMIKDVVPEDAGQYTCRLSNFAGKASCSAELRVEALPRREPMRLSPERGVSDEAKLPKKVIVEPPSMPDQKPVLLDKTTDSAKLSWLPAHVPLKSMSAQPVQYIIEYRELPGDWRRMASKISDTKYLAKGLNPDAEYLFRVRAENDNGMSEPTQPAVLERRAPKVKKPEKDAMLEASQKARTDKMGLSTEAGAGPSMPGDRPTLLDIRPESVRIQWVPVTVPGPGSDFKPVKYLLEVKEIPGPWRKLASGLTGNSYFATDLNPDREYNFRVRAENKFGESEPTQPAILQRGRVVPPALPVSKPYVSDIGQESLRLSWKPADVPKELKGVSPTSYRIEVQELPKPDWQTLVSYIPDTSYRLTDLRPEQDYKFRIRAENEFGLSEPSRPFYLQRATTYPGAAVTRPDIVEYETDAVRLNWQRVEIPRFDADDEPLTYMIEGQTPASDWRELVRGVRGTSHLLSGLEAPEDYSFRVRPDLGARGLGEPSPPMALSRALARTRVPVSDLEIEELEPSSARLRWDRVHIPPYQSSDEPLLYMIECQEGPYANWRTLASGIPTTTFRVSDLLPDKDYAFRVRAESEYGISEPSPPKPLYRRPPEAPRYHLEPPKLEALDDSLQLSWKPISPHPQIRRADPPKYTIEMREAPQVDWRPIAAGIPDTSFRLDGLRPEQDYTFRVRAEMARFPEPVALMTPSVGLIRGGVPPVMPSSSPVISNEKPNSVRLSWRPASMPSYLMGETGPIRYRVEVQDSPNSDWRTLVNRLPEPFYEVTKLHPRQEYSFRVRAETESGTSAPTAPAYLHRKPIPHLPRAEPLLSDIRPDSVRLTWQGVDVPGRAIDFQKVNYLIEMQEPPSQSWVPFVRDVHEINHRIQNLRPDKDYVFRVRAVTDQGMSEPTMSVYLPRRAVQPRLPMSEPYISDVKPDSARLSWSPVDTPPYGAQMSPSTYRVEIQEPPNSNWQTLVRRLPTTNYMLTNLRPDKVYSLRIRAENDFGVSEPTRAITLPKRAVAPIVPSDVPMVSDVRGGNMRLTWRPAHVPSYGGSTVQLPVTYTIEAREPGRDWTPLVRRIPHTSYFLSGLRPDGDYEFRVRAESQYGLSPAGPSTSLPRQQVARIPIQCPQIVDIMPDGRGLVLQWQRANIPSGSGTDLITYVIEAQEPPSMDWSPVASGIMDTKFRVSNLRPNQDYLFRVRAQTHQGLSEPTLPVTFYRRLVAPRVPVERPQLYDLEPDAVRLSWQPTSTYRSETPLRYTVEVREPQIKKWRPLVKSLPDTSYHVTGLKPKLDYEFRVRPESDKGLLEPTPSIPLYRKRVLPPLRFEEPKILEDEPETVSLQWQRVTVPRFDSGDEELTYMIEAQKGPALEWEPIARNIRDTSYRVTGLGPYDDYHFRIRGESRDFGYTDPSPPMPLYRKPILPNVPISRPVIEDVDMTSVRLGWQRVHIPSFGGDDTPMTYMIEGKDSLDSDSDWRPIASDIRDTRYQVRDLKPRQDYSFRIRGVKGPEISDPTPPLPVFRSPLGANWKPIRDSRDVSLATRPYFECLSIKVPPSMPIEKPILTDISGDSVGLTWRPARVPPNSSPPTYNVEFRKLPNMNWQRLAGGLTMTTYKATKLHPDRSYMFRIKAENEFGTSGSTMPCSLGRTCVDLRMTFSDDEDDGDHGFSQKATPRLPMDKPAVFEESPDVFVVSWSPARIPAYSKPSPIRYIIEKREPPSHDWTRAASNIAETRHVVKGLKPNKDIMFRVRAESDFGVSDPTLAASVNRRPAPAPIIPPRVKDVEEESLMLAPSTFVSGSVGTATPPRAPTGRPAISDVTDNGLELSWFPARVPAYMKNTPVTYAVEIREPPSTAWAPLVSGLTETGHSVKHLKPNKDYMFRVKAENEYGASEPTLPAILERQPEPKPEPEKRMTPRPSPRSTPVRSLARKRTPSMDRETTPLRFQSREATPLRYTSREPTPLRKGSISGLPVPAELIAPFDSDIQYAVEGRQGLICLGLRGFPLPTIQWFHKGKILDNDDKYNAVISPAGEATLTINDVTVEDIGEYKCNAENEQGVAVKIVQLDVADSPTFIEPLKDVTIFAKDSGVLECRVDGIPYPEVKWMKDWRPLVETSRIFMDHESPDYWCLTLNNAMKSDAGLYACVVENVAGKVHCVANVSVEDQSPSKTGLNFKQANIEDHYHILEEIGRGRSSIVRRVIEKSTGKEFAAKFIQVRDAAEKDIFRNELECLRLANHKNIAALQDAYETERRLVLVTELVTGPELLDKVVSEGAWTECDAAYFTRQLLDVLQHLHSEGVVVVDLKPWDIQLSLPGSDELKLLDLGFARRLAASRDIRTNYGTAEFVAPEILRGEPLSVAADVWSVGVVAYVLLSGVSPFYNESQKATLLNVECADWDFDAKAFENVSKEARDFISKVLLKEPGERLTVSECLDHPWVKLAIKRGQGMKINTDSLKALNDRYKSTRAITAAKTVADVRPLGKLTGARDDDGLLPVVDPASGDIFYPDSQAYGEYLDEETWHDWQTRYQQGPGTQLLPLNETDLPLRIRKYRKETDREARSPSVESEIGEDRKMMKQRLHVSDLDKEMEPSPTRRKENEWMVQPEEVKEKRRRTSSESETQIPKPVAVRTDEGFSPVFLEKLRDRAYLVGEDVTFTCVVSASPTPSITWYRNEGMLSDGQRIRTSFTEDGRASLTILSTMPNDIGVYKCIVRNKLGTLTSKARLLLGDNPERPGRPVVCAVSSDEALLIWDAPKCDGNSHITSYKVDYRKAGEERWVTAAYVLDECALIQNLKPSTIYRYRVSCLNHFGASPYSWSSVEVRTKPPGAPKVVIDEEIERLLLRSRRALEQPSPRESAVRKDSETLSTIEEEMKSASPEQDFNFGEDIRKGQFSSIKCVSRKANGEEFVAKVVDSDSKKKDELVREFAVLRPLQQENIIQLVSGYHTPKQTCLVMERLYGDNVVQHLSFKNTYTEESVATIMRQVLDAVQYLHHAGIAHLNLQPSSVMLASRRRLDVRLIDFSLARTMTCPEGSHMPKIGYPDFISPEMVAQERVGFAADLWTIGVLSFLLLSGESPFLGETDLETFANIAYNRYDAQDLYENVTKEGTKFIYDMLKRLPKNRPTIEDCLEHKWLQLTPNMVKARQDAVFLSNKLRRYAKDYQLKRQERSGVYIPLSTPPPVLLRPKAIETKEQEYVVQKPKTPSPEPVTQKPKTPSPEPVVQKPKTPSPEPVVQKPKTPSPEPVAQKAKTPSPEPVVQKAKTPSPEPVVQKPKTPSPEPVAQKPKTPSPEPVVQKPKTPSPEPVVQKAKTPSPEPVVQKTKTPSPEPMVEKPKTPSPEPAIRKPKTQSPEPVKERVKTPSPEPVIEKPRTPSPEPVKEQPKMPSPEPVQDVKELTPEITIQSPKDKSLEELTEQTVADTTVIVEVESGEVSSEIPSEAVDASLYITEEAVSPMPGATPERDTTIDNIESIVEISEQSSTTQSQEMTSIITTETTTTSFESAEEVTVQISSSVDNMDAEESVSLNLELPDVSQVDEESTDVTLTLPSEEKQTSDEVELKLSEEPTEVTISSPVIDADVTITSGSESVVESETPVVKAEVTLTAEALAEASESTVQEIVELDSVVESGSPTVNAAVTLTSVSQGEISESVVEEAVESEFVVESGSPTVEAEVTLTSESLGEASESAIVEASLTQSEVLESDDRAVSVTETAASELKDVDVADETFVTATVEVSDTTESADITSSVETVNIDSVVENDIASEVTISAISKDIADEVSAEVTLTESFAKSETEMASNNNESDIQVRLSGRVTSEQVTIVEGESSGLEESAVVSESGVSASDMSTDVEIRLSESVTSAEETVSTESAEATILETTVQEETDASVTKKESMIEESSASSSTVVSSSVEFQETGKSDELVVSSEISLGSSVAGDVSGSSQLTTSESVTIIESGSEVCGTSVVEAKSSLAEETVDIFGNDEDDDYFAKRMRRSAQAAEVVAAEQAVVEDDDDSFSRRSSRRSRRSERSAEYSGIEESTSGYSEESYSSRRSRRSERSYEVSEESSSSRESRRSGWRSRLGDL